MTSYRGQRIDITAEKISWRHSLQVKMSLTLIIITTTVFCGFVIYGHFAAKAQKSAQLRELANITSQRLAKSLADPLWSIDKVRIEDILVSEMNEKRIYGIVIKDDDGETAIFGKRRNEAWEPVHVETEIGDGYIKDSTAIMHESRPFGPIGVLEVFFTSKFMNAELKKSIIELIVTAVTLNIAIFLTTLLFMRKIIIKPIRQLWEATLRMSKGDLSMQFETNYRGEIGMLAQSIERVQISMGLALKRIKTRTDAHVR